MLLTILFSTAILFDLGFDKIEKKGTLLNTTCSLFGTRCTASGMNQLIQYTFLVNEPSARLSIHISEKEAIKNQALYSLLYNKTTIELNEPMNLPSEICNHLNVPSNFIIPSGTYRVMNKNNAFEILLMIER
jgi:hypothetical protein